jgi:ABC-type amino acid transport substrate-binding protein
MTLEPSRAVVHIGLSKTTTTEQDFKAIDKALKRLLADGTIDRITRSYGAKAN